MKKKKVDEIPSELFEAFNQKEIGYSLLIKGDAGTGKSTFALTMLSIFEDYEPIYISTRVAPTSLYSQFPWIEKRLKEENVIDATRTYLPPIGDPKEMKTHVLRTIRFSEAPEFLKIMYDKIEKYNNTIIVIDSWDAIVGFSDTSKSQEWETILTEFVRQMNVKLILVAEHSHRQTYLDYIVDGIITLRDEELENGRILREMEINKIRGTERKQKRYNYSLYDNRFSYCPPYVDEFPDIDLNNDDYSILNWQILQSNKKNLYSTGTKDIDDLYNGGLKNSSLNMWEVDSDVPLSSLSNIMIPLISNFVSQDFGTIIYSIDGLNTRFVDKNKLFITLDMEKISNNVRFLVENIPFGDIVQGSEIRPYVIPFKQKDFEKAFSKGYKELAEKSSFKPVLSIVGYELRNLAGEEILKNDFSNHLKFVRNFNVIEIAIFNQMKGLKSNFNTKGPLDDISYFFDTHVKMIFRNNSIYIYGIKPYSVVYLLKMKYDTKKSISEIQLIPMV